MPRAMRVEYPGAIYHVMDRDDRRKDIFVDDVDRQDFLKTLAEAGQKTGWQIHAYGLMRNHFHLVLETPNANRVAGMRWFLSAYTIRLNHRQKLFGHVFSGRYKALLVEGSGHGYLKTACDYVHLNPVRARLLGTEDRPLAYPGSSFGWYLAAPEHRPAWACAWTACWVSTASRRTRRWGARNLSGTWRPAGSKRLTKKRSSRCGAAGAWAAKRSDRRCWS
jgi:REP element-mobilizing transposase RayT